MARAAPRSRPPESFFHSHRRSVPPSCRTISFGTGPAGTGCRTGTHCIFGVRRRVPPRGGAPGTDASGGTQRGRHTQTSCRLCGCTARSPPIRAGDRGRRKTGSPHIRARQRIQASCPARARRGRRRRDRPPARLISVPRAVRRATGRAYGRPRAPAPTRIVKPGAGVDDAGRKRGRRAGTDSPSPTRDPGEDRIAVSREREGARGRVLAHVPQQPGVGTSGVSRRPRHGGLPVPGGAPRARPGPGAPFRPPPGWVPGATTA